MERKRIAIVGSGVSGLSALWTLRNSGHEIHLFEKTERLGGHTNTAIWEHNGHSTPVDTGFIVLNTATYPNFIAFLSALNIQTIPSKMTFGISRDQGAFEWSGTNLFSLFAQRSNFFKPSFWRMIFDIVRFNQFALDLISNPATSKSASEPSISEYLKAEGYSDAFRDNYLIPMTASVWSAGPEKCALEFPAITLVRFMWNHHLLTTVSERPPWLTVQCGSKRYVDAVMRECKDAAVYIGTSVESATRTGGKVGGKVELKLSGKAGERVEVFDEVILACHGDQARDIVRPSASVDEERILEAFETTPNTAYLHSDLSLMPKRRAAWSAWSYLTSQPPNKTPDAASGDLQTVTLTYNMNILQSLPTSKFGDILVTLNPEKPPSPSLTQAAYQYRHPLYNARVVAAQEELEEIQGRAGVWYAGAWTGYGFHEDGFASGMRIGLRLGGEVPWEEKNAKFSRGVKPVLGQMDYLVRAVVMVVQLVITMLEGVYGIRRARGRTEESGAAVVIGGSISNGKAKIV